MWVELVDLLMIDVGCTDVTWSHAWNSVWVSSYRHFLVVSGWLVNIMRGSRGCWSSWQGSQCTLSSALDLYWTSRCAPGCPQAPPYWGQNPGLSTTLFCADIFIPSPHHLAVCLLSICLSPFLSFALPGGQTFILSLYFSFTFSFEN